MQGTLNEIDIRSILQLVALGQRTGELLVEAWQTDRNQGKFWFVFFRDGKLVYAADGSTGLQRLQDYLYRFKVNLDVGKLPRAVDTAPEYSYLWRLIENRTLNPNQGRSIIYYMVKETLFDLLTLHQGYFIFEGGSGLSPQLMTWEVEQTLAEAIKQVQEWKQFYPYIQSPDQCPTIVDIEKLHAFLPENAFKTLDRWADGKTSLRQIARYLNREILAVTKAIYPCIQQGWVQISHPSPVEDNAFRDVEANAEVKIQIACIDDDETIGQVITHMLQKHGYEVMVIKEPLASFQQLFQLPPRLILCDLSMPQLDGYDLCGMLRQSTLFRQVPIIMLTGRDGFIDRVRAKMVGATDYLTKPFQEEELLMLLEKYLTS